MATKNNTQSSLNFVNEDAQDFLPKLKKNSMNLVLTDPPYLVSRHTNFADIGVKGVERFRVSMDFGEWDNITNGEHIESLTTVFQHCYDLLVNGGTIIVFYDLWKLETLACILKQCGFVMLRFIEWLKTNPVPLNARKIYLSNAREVAIVAVKKGKPLFKGYYHNGVFPMPIHRDGGARIHPTQKPLELMKELINLHTNKGDNILDPFAGSGTTLKAAIELQRHAVGCEIDSKYYQKALDRLGGNKCLKQK